jgi:transposase
MAASCAAVAARAGQPWWPAAQGSPTGAERDLVDPAFWRTLARSAGALWCVADGGEHLLPLAPCWGVGTGIGRPAAPGGRAGRTGLGAAPCRQYGGPGAPARCRRKRGQQHEALGRSRGGFSTKIHLRCDGNGRPLVFHLTGGEAADYKALPHLLDDWQVHRSGPGRPRKRPDRLVADRSYSNQHVRILLRRRGIGSVIPQPKNQRPRFLLDPQAYRARNQVERLVGRLKQCRRIATRYVRAAKQIKENCQLPGHAADRRHHALAASLRTRPRD